MMKQDFCCIRLYFVFQENPTHPPRPLTVEAVTQDET